MNLIGDIYGRLKVISRHNVNTNRGRPQWLCVCECGNKKIVSSSNLRQGGVKSCGCLLIESALNASEKHMTHGLTGSRLEQIYKGMITRCYNKKCHAYKDYGGRGIYVCHEWKNNRSSFFKWAFNNGYKDDLTIDRKDNDLEYSPGNCRWSTRIIQARNTRRNKIITFNGKSAPLSEWAERLNMPMKSLWYRLNAGWSVQKTFMTPIRNIRKRRNDT